MSSRNPSYPNRFWARSGLAVVLVALPALACYGESDPEAKVVATIDGQPVRMTAVDSLVGDQLAQMERQYHQERYDLTKAAAERAVRDRLLEQEAATRGLTLAEFIAQQAAGQVEVTDEDVVVFYRQNIGGLGGRSIDEVRPQIREYLETREVNAILDSIGDELASTRDIAILVEPVRAELNNEGSPASGPRNAPIVLTEFSDFECPFCRRFYDTLNRLKEEYEGQLRVVYRQYPLNIHPNAHAAAEASLCAEEQGEFWAMHDLMFEEQTGLDAEGLKEKAARIGLNEEEFAACLASGRFAEQIRRDREEADRLGITGTPFVFINGISVPGGAAPYEVIKEMIDEELARAGN